MGLGDKILENRKKLGISQEELAEKLDVSRQTISKWETEKSTPELEKLVKLSEIFDVSVDELVKEEKMEGKKAKKEKNKKRVKIIISVFLKIFLVLLAIVIIIYIYQIFCRKNAIEGISSIYQERFEKIGEEYNARITEIIETLDNASNYTYSRKNYVYFAENGKRLVRIDYYKTGSSDAPEEIIYIDLNKVNSGYYYNDVIVIDTLANTYQEVDNYNFKSPIDNQIENNICSVIADSESNKFEIVLDRDNTFLKIKSKDQYIGDEYMGNMLDGSINFVIGKYECSLFTNLTSYHGIKEIKEESSITMVIVNHIAEEEVTPPSSEDYTVIQ